MDLLGKGLLVFFLIMGLVETCRLLLLWLLRPEKMEEAALVVPLTGHVEDAEYLLRSAAQSFQWDRSRCPKRLICVDGGMDQETKEICLHLQRELPFLEICSPQELGEVLFPKRKEENPPEDLK